MRMYGTLDITIRWTLTTQLLNNFVRFYIYTALSVDWNFQSGSGRGHLENFDLRTRTDDLVTVCCVVLVRD